MSDQTYTMSVLIEKGRYAERETLFTAAKDIILIPNAEFQIQDGAEEHSIDVYGVPNHATVLEVLRKLLAIQAEYRKVYPASRTNLIVSTYADRDEPFDGATDTVTFHDAERSENSQEGVDDSHPIGCPCSRCPA